jgi:phospholipase C
MRGQVALFLTMVLFAAGCSGAPTALPGASSGTAAQMLRVRGNNAPIQHVIVMVQGHRGFDNLFAGFPGADSAKQGLTHTGKVVPLKPMTMAQHPSSAAAIDAFVTAYDDGKMDGFDLVYKSGSLFPYHYVEHSESSQYWRLARQFVLADHMFSSSISNSGWVAQLYPLAARSKVKAGEYLADHPSQEPWGCDAPAGTTTPVFTKRGIRLDGPFPCFDWNSLPQLLDDAHVTWRYYLPAGGQATNAIDAIGYVRNGNDWSGNLVTPQTAILSDIQKGTLPSVSWVYPQGSDSDDPGTGSGSKWVGTVVAALKKSPYWQHSAVIVTWEASDFFYDNVTPPILSTAELGFRVPLIVVSPYAKRGYVSHTQYEFGSIVRFIEERFALPSLNQTDRRANSLDDAFTF